MEAKEAALRAQEAESTVPAIVTTTTTTATTTAAGQAREAVEDIIAGSVGGAVGKIIEYPFDTVKVRLQAQPVGRPLLYDGPLDCFRKSIARDGVLEGLFRGVGTPTAGAAVETSALFLSYRLAQSALQASVYGQTQQLPLSALCVCGAVSGAFTSLVLTPIELVKCKMQVPEEHVGTVRPSTTSTIMSVFRQHGLFGFWHGQLGTLIRETGGGVTWFGSFEASSAFFRARNQQLAPNSDGSLAIWQQLLGGALAGMSYQFFFYPADTIKSRMQTEESGDIARRTFMETGRLLWKEHGLGGMYRGCAITVARAAPSSAVIFTIYEALKGAMRRQEAAT